MNPNSNQHCSIAHARELASALGALWECLSYDDDGRTFAVHWFSGSGNGQQAWEVAHYLVRLASYAPTGRRWGSAALNTLGPRKHLVYTMDNPTPVSR